MRFVKRVLLLILVATPAASVSACTIVVIGDGTPRSRLHHAKSVFVGEALEITDSMQDDLERGASRYAIRFKVEQDWKGVRTPELTVHSDLTGCGPNFQVGQKYLVYALGKTLEASPLGGREVEKAGDDLKVLGPG